MIFQPTVLCGLCFITPAHFLILQVLSPISQEFLRSPDTTLSQLLNIKVGELVEEDEMLDSVINREKAEQLKVKQCSTWQV